VPAPRFGFKLVVTGSVDVQPGEWIGDLAQTAAWLAGQCLRLHLPCRASCRAFLQQLVLVQARWRPRWSWAPRWGRKSRRWPLRAASRCSSRWQRPIIRTFRTLRFHLVLRAKRLLLYVGRLTIFRGGLRADHSKAPCLSPLLDGHKPPVVGVEFLRV
jgi:hypothetical protein